jgi:hypothetical protein
MKELDTSVKMRMHLLGAIRPGFKKGFFKELKFSFRVPFDLFFYT